MKKIVFTSLVLCIAVFACQNAYAQNYNVENSNVEFYRCGQVEYENYLRSQDPDFDKKKMDMEKVIQEGVAKIEQEKLNGNPTVYTQYTLPVVFHVVWNTTAENISDVRILAQLDQLNKDFSRTNSDAGNTPAVWQSISANMQVQFCLATKDPNGNPTTGILRKQTSVSSFTTNDNVKSSATGGDNPWNTQKYLNIWICNLSGGTLGFTTTPPSNCSAPPPSNYGAVVKYCTVGSMTVPGTCSQKNIGRILTHEIGHGLSLMHTWGDDGGTCSGTDGVSDTPNQASSSSGCPSFPKTDACSPSSPGIMFMNYMDYSNDGCMNMFTAKQRDRAQVVLAGCIHYIANNALTACGPLAVPNLALEDNISLFPNPSNGDLSLTVDIPNVAAADIIMFNAIGDVVLSKKVSVSSNKEVKLNLHDKANGIYLVKIEIVEGTVTKKIVLNR